MCCNCKIGNEDVLKMSKKKLSEVKIGLVDADLLDNGTRHPNLALLKIAGLLHEKKEKV